MDSEDIVSLLAVCTLAAILGAIMFLELTWGATIILGIMFVAILFGGFIAPPNFKKKNRNLGQKKVMDGLNKTKKLIVNITPTIIFLVIIMYLSYLIYTHQHI